MAIAGLGISSIDVYADRDILIRWTCPATPTPDEVLDRAGLSAFGFY
jgi:hypothetical protein